MFRSDRDVLAQEVEELRREREGLVAQNEAMRADILATRRKPQPVAAAGSIYKRDVASLTPGERTALARHSVDAFPTWAVVVLHFLTLGIFPLVHFSALHGRLPAIDHDDPTAGKAIGFSFIPYFSMYWLVFNAARLADRINFQFRLRGLPEPVPRTFTIFTAVAGVIPYVCWFIAWPFIWPVAIIFLQRAANKLAALPRDGTDVAVRRAGAQAPGAPRVRVPLVADLPGPDDAVEQQAEVEADEVLRARHGVR
jgi:hypothetical protein